MSDHESVTTPVTTTEAPPWEGDLRPAQLDRGRETRILLGHRWVFSNEIQESLKTFQPGEWVEIFSAKGVSMGTGYINPRSLIAARIVFPAGTRPSEEAFRALIAAADARRRRAYPGETCYRMIFGESDGLPGLVVDRYDDVLVCQITTAGMERLRPWMLAMLADAVQPRCIVLRNDLGVRGLEGLPRETEVALGEAPEPFWAEIDGVRCRIDALQGQKTGTYLDQRDNRRAAARWMEGKRVLDLFCYEGGWSLAAAKAGAVRTLGIDQSRRAVESAAANAAENGFAGVCRFESEDVLSFMKTGLRKDDFDVIVVDPPAFAKSKKDLPQAVKGYTDLNRRALLALKPGGMLVSCSCSHHLAEDVFAGLLLNAAKAAGRRLRLIEARGQGLDHPALLAMPETRYLKCMILEVTE